MSSIIFWTVLITIWVVASLAFVPKVIALRSKSSWRWLRKLYWGFVKEKMVESMTSVYSDGHKVRTYFAQYLNRSVAAKELYLNTGFVNARFELTAKVEALERMVEEYKYNTFDNLDFDEEDFINKWEKKNKRGNL